VYLSSGSLAVATVGTDDDFRRQLIASRLVTDDGMRSAEIGGRSVAEVLTPGTGTQALVDLFREETIESLYRIRKPGRGQFVFNVDVAPRYRSDQSFDVELCVAEADRRAADWADIESVIPSIDLSLRINAEAPNGEPVTLAPNTWRLVAAFEGIATVRSLSDRLGISRFRVAKDLAALVRSSLVEAVQPAAPTVPEPVPVGGREPERVSYGWPSPAEEQYPYVEPVSHAVEEQPTPAERAVADHAATRTWWEEPQAPATPAATDTIEVVGAQPPEGQIEEEKPADQSADAFLDRVFSQLKETPEGEGVSQPGAGGHGFLKRRRMSSIGADE
jgi:hypothetical protein